MSNVQISNIQMPQLKEIANTKQPDVDQGFKFALLSNIDESELQEKLTQMIEKITDQGEKLSTHMDIRDLRSYREMISEFFNEVTARTHKFSRESFLDKKGRHRVYGIVRMVNEQLDGLAKELMRSEKNQIEILEKIGEIQGLLLDIAT